MYLDRKFGLNLSLSEITLLFDLSLYLDRTLAQRKLSERLSQKLKLPNVCQFAESSAAERLIVFTFSIPPC